MEALIDHQVRDLAQTHTTIHGKIAMAHVFRLLVLCRKGQVDKGMEGHSHLEQQQDYRPLVPMVHKHGKYQ